MPLERATSLPPEAIDLESLWLSRSEYTRLCLSRLHTVYHPWTSQKYHLIGFRGIMPEVRGSQRMAQQIDNQVRLRMGDIRNRLWRRRWGSGTPTDTAPYELLLQLLG